MKILVFTLFIVTFCIVPTFAQTDDAQSLFERVRRLELNRRYDEAVTVITEAIKLQPDNPEFYLERAGLNNVLKNKQGVLEDVRAALTLKPNDFDLAERGAMRLLSSGQYEESLRIAENLLSSDSEGRYHGYQIRYKTRIELKDYKGAFDDVIKEQLIFSAIEDDSMSRILDGLKDDPNIENYYGKLFAFIKDSYENGPGGTGMTMAIHKANILLYAEYAKYYKEKHNNAEVKALFDKYEKDLGLYTRAGIYERLENYDAATIDLMKSLKSTEKVSEYFKNRGDRYFIFGQLEKSIKLYETAKKINNDEHFQKIIDDDIRISKSYLIEKANQPK